MIRLGVYRPDERPEPGASRRNGHAASAWRWLVVGHLVACGAAGWLLLRVAGEEPFLVAREIDAWTFVALPACLFCGELAVLVLVLVLVSSRFSRSQDRFGVLAIFATGLLVLGTLLFVPHAYASDLVRFTAPSLAGTPPP